MSTQSRNWLKFSGLLAATFLMVVFFARMFNFPVEGLAQERSGTIPSAIEPVPAPNVPEARSLTELSNAFAAVTDAVRASVVFIIAEGTRSGPSADQLPPNYRLPPGFRLPDAPTPSRAIGSGFVVSKDGYILTNHHVIEGATRIRVRLLDEREFVATVVGSDKSTDVGVLKIDATGLSPASLGSSEAVKVGEWVLAIGNPLGDNLTFSVTQGIVSAKGRGIPLEDSTSRLNIQDFIQTDAAINRGNSGGPLLNVKGEVVGINSAIASTTGTYQGYAFAIPIDLATQVMNHLIAYGRFERSLLQIQVANADADDAAYLDLPSIAGVRVVAFSDPESPAKVAGLVPGDVIVRIDGKPIKYTGQLQQIVGFTRPGDPLKVEVARKGGHKEFTVRPVASPVVETPAPAVPERDTPPAKVATNRLGLFVEPIDPTNAARLRTNQGLLVVDVVPGSSAAGKILPRASGRPDVVLDIEGRAIRSEDDLKAAVASAKNDVVTVTVLRDGIEQVVRLRLTPP